MEVEIRNWLYPILILLSSSTYCHSLVTKIPKGIPRILSILPVIYLFTLLPWYSSSSFLRGVLYFFITWISSFKLLLFCYNRGPLFPHRNHLDFLVITVLPLNLKEGNNIPSSSSEKLCNSTFVKLFLTSIFMLILSFYMKNESSSSVMASGFLRGGSVLYGFYTVRSMGRYDPVRLLNEPYLATSLQDFWGRRWNRLSSGILRQAVYDPTRLNLTGIVGGEVAKVVALLFTLAVSGVLHEYMFYYITCGKKPTWEVALFFILHGVCMVVETVVKRKFGRVKMTSGLRVGLNVLTVGFVVVTAYWLLVLPVWRSAQNDCGFHTKS